MRHDNGTTLALGAAALLALAAAASRRLGSPNDDDDYVSVDNEIADAMRGQGRPNIGLNADWSVRAWEIGLHNGSPAYLIDNENETYSVVVRYADPHTITELQRRFGWRQGQPVPFEAYTDTLGNRAPEAYRDQHDGYNDIIAEVWNSDYVLTAQDVSRVLAHAATYGASN